MISHFSLIELLLALSYQLIMIKITCYPILQGEWAKM
jgi:hypothetical protein